MPTEIPFRDITDWMDTERIACSELLRFWFFNASSESDKRDFEGLGQDLFFLLSMFACGDCHDIARAAAIATGQSVLIIRRADLPEDAILHAFLLDSRSSVLIDVLGPHLASQILPEFRRRFGPIEIAIQSAADLGQDDASEDLELAPIVAGIPWFPRPASMAPTDFSELRHLVRARARRVIPDLFDEANRSTDV